MTPTSSSPVWNLVAPHVAHRSGRVAIIADDATLTYAELDRATAALATAMARWATASGPHSEAAPEAELAVGALVRPSAAGLVVVLAALRAGVALVPLDPTHPPARLRALAQAAGVGPVVATPGTAAVAATLDRPHEVVVPLAALDDPRAPVAVLPNPVPATADALVYVTSGSTGGPKPVVHDHRSLVSNIRAVSEVLGLGGDDVGVLVASLSFAASFSSSLPLLAVGGAVTVVDPLGGDTEHLVEAIERTGGTSLSCVPSIHRALLRGRRSAGPVGRLRQVVLGGEAVHVDDVRLHREVLGSRVDLVNRYSSSESFGISSLRISGRDPIDGFGDGVLPVGRPLPGREVRLEPLEGMGEGSDGVVVVVGDALGRRYARDPERSAAVFGALPDGRSTVRTADLARLRGDGALELRGRIDDIVKVNGMRVHLGEVRAALRSLDGVADAVVALDGRRLVARVEPSGAAALDPPALRSALARMLPLSAVPSRVEVVAALPRTDRGKLHRTLSTDRTDRETGASRQQNTPGGAPADGGGAVRPAPRTPPPDATPPDPTPPDATPLDPHTAEVLVRDVPAPAGATAPAGRIEREIAAIWAGLLDVAAVGADDDLFALGADSLMAVEVLSTLRDRYDLDVTPRQLLGGMTVRTLAKLASRIELPPTTEGRVLRLPGAAGGAGAVEGRPAVILISGIAATPLAMVPLARLLHAAGLDPLLVDSRPSPGRMPDRSVGWSAARIVGDLGRVAPDGPIGVVGYSVGSMVAHEVASVLRATGREVPLLGLLDFAPRPPEEAAAVRRRHRDRALVAARRGDLRTAAAHAEIVLTEPVSAPLLALSSRLPQLDPSRHARLRMAVGRRAAARHEALPWAGRALLVWSRPRADGRARWGPLLAGPVEEVTVGGDHISMLYRPQVDDLAAALVAALGPVAPVRPGAAGG